MSELFGLSFDAIATSALACMFLREILIFALPSKFAGPGGSFIDTNPR